MVVVVVVMVVMVVLVVVLVVLVLVLVVLVVLVLVVLVLVLVVLEVLLLPQLAASSEQYRQNRRRLCFVSRAATRAEIAPSAFLERRRVRGGSRKPPDRPGSAWRRSAWLC